ncbi:hypothetical protein AOQ89_00175 [bacterium endosymbiont of Pedicinus badii]|nr:hypothetical protein [bacterium endosymbiont of Pedicinus badii]OQM34304.1 hypothetical protein AOQ89_00175 [bacterium endosymbiont of Pedicinus badii]
MNVDTNLTNFFCIDPCGSKKMIMTNMSDYTTNSLKISYITKILKKNCINQFQNYEKKIYQSKKT